MTTVSVVIPVYNGSEYVAEAIHSVLTQTHPPIECLVIDDGSTDATPDVVANFGNEVNYVRLDRGGQSRARNHGAALARGDLVAFLDHDDVWLPRKLERQIAALAAQAHANLVLCAMEVFAGAGTSLRVQRLSPPDHLIEGLLLFDAETVGINSNAVVRRNWLLAVGGYDPVLGICGDWDLLVRTLLDGEVAYIDEPLLRYRLHGTNLHRQIGLMERDMRYAFAKTFANPRLPAAIRAQRRHAYGRMYRMLAGSYRDVGHRTAMIRTLSRALSYDPRIATELLIRPRRQHAATPPSTHRRRQAPTKPLS